MRTGLDSCSGSHRDPGPERSSLPERRVFPEPAYAVSPGFRVRSLLFPIPLLNAERLKMKLIMGSLEIAAFET